MKRQMFNNNYVDSFDFIFCFFVSFFVCVFLFFEYVARMNLLKILMCMCLFVCDGEYI